MAAVGNHQRRGGPRGKVSGWSPGAARRNVAFLRSVDERTLTGVGLAITLTVRDCPPSAAAWRRAVKIWIDRQARVGLLRLHWVMEFQRRGTPHLHVAAWYEEGIEHLPGPEVVALHKDMHGAGDDHVAAGLQAVRDWLTVTKDFGSGAKGQQVRPLVGPVGWFRYLAKHCGRGRQHYQRQQEALPKSWESVPRVWGYRGSWDLQEPATAELTGKQWFQLRRLARRLRVAEARQGLPCGSWREMEARHPLLSRDILRGWGGRPGSSESFGGKIRRVRFARRMLRCTERKRSEVQGISEWLTEQQQANLLRAIGGDQ